MLVYVCYSALSNAGQKKTRGESLIRRSLGSKWLGLDGWSRSRRGRGKQAAGTQTNEAGDSAVETDFWRFGTNSGPVLDDKLARCEDERGKKKKWAWIVSREREYGGRRTQST